MNKTRFIEVYARRMKAQSDANPGLYVVPASWTDLAARMTEGLVTGRANLSDAARASLKELGAEPTYAGANAFLTAP